MYEAASVKLFSWHWHVWSITQNAAEEIGISQPTLSHAIAGLEEELGVKLFRKQGRNVVLTKYGRIFPGVCGGIHECTGTGSL